MGVKTERIPTAWLVRYMFLRTESRFDRIIRETKEQLTRSSLIKQTLERR